MTYVVYESLSNHTWEEFIAYRPFGSWSVESCTLDFRRLQRWLISVLLEELHVTISCTPPVRDRPFGSWSVESYILDFRRFQYMLFVRIKLPLSVLLEELRVTVSCTSPVRGLIKFQIPLSYLQDTVRSRPRPAEWSLADLVKRLFTLIRRRRKAEGDPGGGAYGCW
jgi:hypothetical protein